MIAFLSFSVSLYFFLLPDRPAHFHEREARAIGNETIYWDGPDGTIRVKGQDVTTRLAECTSTNTKERVLSETP